MKVSFLVKAALTIATVAGLTITASASTVINCHVSKDGKRLVSGVKLNSKSRGANPWGPSTGANFHVADSSGKSIPVMLGVHLDGQNLLEISLSKASEGFRSAQTFASKRQVISSTRPILVTLNAQNDMGLSVSCMRN